MYEYINLSLLIGKTLVSCERTTYDGSDAIRFEDDQGKVYYMAHEQDCCEAVWLDDLNGDLNDLVDAPILMAEQVDGQTPGFEDTDYVVWTFYRFESTKGFVYMRWCGESEYYSVEVKFFEKGKPYGY